jgi:hypothetical protein
LRPQLVALLGKDAGGLSASTIGSLKDAWSDEHLRWSRRDLTAKRYVYFWADGIPNLHVKDGGGGVERNGVSLTARASPRPSRSLVFRNREN